MFHKKGLPKRESLEVIYLLQFIQEGWRSFGKGKRKLLITKNRNITKAGEEIIKSIEKSAGIGIMLRSNR